MPEKSILDARLAEIDRRLRKIQSGLAPATQPEGASPGAREAKAEPPDLEPGRSPEPLASPEPVVPPEAAPVPKRLADAPAASDAADLVAQLRALLEAHERLLASTGDVLVSRAAPAPEQAVGVSAGPFENIEALRRFEHSLRALPEVRAVTVREYEGADRVILDVHLATPTP